MSAKTWTRLWSLSVRLVGPESAVTSWLERRALDADMREWARKLGVCCREECFGDGTCSCGYDREEGTEE